MQDDENRILRLIESMVESRSTPEEVCKTCPELLPRVRDRWRVLRKIDAEIDAIFPASSSSRQAGFSLRNLGDLPKIPGYEITATLGRGGMGVVYKALHLKLNRVVALKMLLSGSYSSDHERQRFVREAKAIAQLKHPALVQIYNVGGADGCPYYTMEFISGGSLAQKLAGVPQSPHFAAEIVATIASAIHAAHQVGIIHRDLKPSNVLLCEDGSPKIADFGLARHVEAEPDLTQSGARLGTPCYMSPEQVRNRAGTVGPPADLYSLGAILYEMLAGRPPFRGETAADTERQILTDEPASLTGLNSKTPRDLETICLKCLQKEPHRRYANGVELAEDLRRYQNGEPILARPVGPIERTFKWTRRRPAQAVLVASAVLMAFAGAGGAIWFVSSRAGRTRAVEGDLQQVVDLEQTGSWPEAENALLRAKIELGSRGPQSLHDQLEAHQHELQVVARLDHLQDRYAWTDQGKLNLEHSLQDFIDALQDLKLGNLNDDPAVLAKRFQSSPIRNALLNALYVDLILNPRPQKLELAKLVDPDSTGWRDRALESANWCELTALQDLLKTVDIDSQPVALQLAVAMRCQSLGGNVNPFLKKLQARYPDDYWANLMLAGNYFDPPHISDCIRYSQAAVSSRPSAAMAEERLAYSLCRNAQPEEGVIHYRNAIRLDPDVGVAHSNLGLALDQLGNHTEAIRECKRAIELEPKDAWFHTVLGGCYRADGQKAEALAQYQISISLRPRDEAANQGLNACLDKPRTAEQRRAQWEALLDNNPADFEVWDGYAQFCLYLGHQDKYQAARQKLLMRFGDTTQPHIEELAGRACLLMPGTDEEIRKATAMIDRALANDSWTVTSLKVYFNLAKALADYRQGNFKSAVGRLEGTDLKALAPVPCLILAMAHYQLGEVSQSRQFLERGIKSFDWSNSNATTADAWMFHALRHEAESLISPKPHDKE